MAIRKGAIVYCGWADCQIGYPLLGTGKLPQPCPGCLRETRWTTTPPWRLSWNDRQFLRLLKIDPEEKG